MYMLAISEKEKINQDETYLYFLVGKNIKRLRKEKNLKVADLSKLTNYSEGYIMNIESQKYLQTFSIGILYTFAKALEVEPYELLKEYQYK